MWDSAMAENGMLKLGKVTDFQCHMLEHAVGAYTNCNHGQGLAIIHPAFYRHYLPEGIEKLAKMARNVWGIAETDEALAAKAGIEALEAFIKEIGLPAHWNEIGVTDEGILRESAYATILTAGCCKRFSHEELFEVLKETM